MDNVNTKFSAFKSMFRYVSNQHILIKDTRSQIPGVYGKQLISFTQLAASPPLRLPKLPLELLRQHPFRLLKHLTSIFQLWLPI